MVCAAPLGDGAGSYAKKAGQADVDVTWDDAEVVVDASVEEEMVELDVAVEMTVEDVVEEVEVVLDEALADEVVASEVTVELALDDFDVEVEVDEVLSQVAVADTEQPVYKISLFPCIPKP